MGDSMSDVSKVCFAKAIATVGVWVAISWILTGINPSGGTVGWALFFMFLTTCAIWDSSLVIK